MPIHSIKSIFDSSILIWKIVESEDYLRSDIKLTENCENRLNTIKSEQRRKQFLSIRKLFSFNNISLSELVYDSNGAPYLKNGKKISISHTNNFAALVISDYNIGIDIQDYREKIISISDKFISAYERQIIDVNSVKELTLIWCIKESVFKIYKKPNKMIDNELLSKTASLLIHAAKMDQKYTEKEKIIIKKTLIELGINENNLDNLILEAEKNEEESSQILDYTKAIKSTDDSFKITLIESLWKIIYSDKNSDMYEANLMRRLTGLLYLDKKLVGDIKLRIKNNLK